MANVMLFKINILLFNCIILGFHIISKTDFLWSDFTRLATVLLEVVDVNC